MLSYKDCLLQNIEKSSIEESSIESNQTPSGMMIRSPPGLTIPTKLKIESLINNQITVATFPTILATRSENLVTSSPINLETSLKTSVVKSLVTSLVTTQLMNRRYPLLDSELNKNRALSSFKNNLINRIIRYLREKHKMFNTGKLKYTRSQMYNHFPNWFFMINMTGKVNQFVPEAPFDIQINLDYILKENGLPKKTDFDTKLLTFNSKYIKDDLYTLEIVINQKDNYVKYHLTYNNGIWKLLPITKKQFTNLQQRYIGEAEQFDELVAITLLRYRFLGGINNHLSIPPIIYKTLNVDFELFASPFNVGSKHFCSPFGDIEKYFGSSGSFSSFSLQDNLVYAANPPYDVQIVQDMAEKLEREMPKMKNVTIYITIPLWREAFPGYDILKKNKFLRDSCELNKDDFPFYHYFKGRLIPASDTYLMVLSSAEKGWKTCHEIKKIWPSSFQSRKI